MNIAGANQVASGSSQLAIAQEMGPTSLLPGDGAIPLISGGYVVTKGSAAALTIAAPAAADVGTRIRVTSDSAFAHVITFTGNTLRGGTAAVATATFAAQAGSGISIECFIVGKWHVITNVVATLA